MMSFSLQMKTVFPESGRVNLASSKKKKKKKKKERKKKRGFLESFYRSTMILYSAGHGTLQRSKGANKAASRWILLDRRQNARSVTQRSGEGRWPYISLSGELPDEWEDIQMAWTDGWMDWLMLLSPWMHTDYHFEGFTTEGNLTQ